MDVMNVELGACRLQLLAMNALLEHARAGMRGEADGLRILRRITEMSLCLQEDVGSVRKEDLGEVEARILCRYEAD